MGRIAKNTRITGEITARVNREQKGKKDLRELKHPAVSRNKSRNRKNGKEEGIWA